MNEYDVLCLIDEAAEHIADKYGHNVPYCESMDMTLFPQPIYAMTDDDEAYLGDLQFLASNGRLLPKSLANASLEEFKAYCREHKEEILNEIASECYNYLEAD